MPNLLNRITKPLGAFRTRYVRRTIDHYAGHPFRLLTAFIQLGLFAHVFTRYGYALEGTMGASMLPTFEVLGDWVLISKHYRRGRDVRVGDMITFRSVVDPEQQVIKRVLGMEGDYVLRDTPGSRSDSMLQVPEGHCWVIGDNVEASRDSRHFGPMPLALIKGKVLAKVFPWRERRWFEDGLQLVG